MKLSLKTFAMATMLMLAAVTTSCESRADKALKAEIEHANKQLPANAGDGYVLAPFTLESDVVNINFTLVGAFDNINALTDSPEARSKMLETLNASPDLRRFCDIVKASGRDIKVNYTHAKSGQAASFTIANAEL